MNEIEELFNAMGEAKEEPSKQCTEENHTFKFLSHADGTEYYMDYYRCEHCKEVVVKKFKRTGMDKALWSDTNE